MAAASVIRSFGDWSLVTSARSDGELPSKLYVNSTTGEVAADPPEAVLEVLEAENAQRRMPVYEATAHRFVPLCAAPPPVPARCNGIDVDSGDEGVAFFLRDFLSAAECQAIISQAEAFGIGDCGYSRDVRVTDRVVAMGDGLAAALFSRAKPFLREVTVVPGEQLPRGVPPSIPGGVWLPIGVNPCFRVCRYAPGGFFVPHYDHGFDIDHTHRSIMTIMMYLNDDFEGGATTFYKDSQQRYRPGEPAKATHVFQPERGSCVIFNHCIVHDGGQLRSGVKYILRSELMYERRAQRDLGDDDDDDASGSEDW
eukprot:NODE_11904_length_1258_cov_7.621574.p1 GENE.NODE_11904_length_1258_cov_7.621574~~NODE_11904_length_1258_cov_7.621574.p1  ORF type:complete len:328 (-),score=86.55 NODE_11904_length_1258_cov_7.621574:273-1205(-)